MPKLLIVRLTKDRQVRLAGFYRFGNEYTAFIYFFLALIYPKLNILKSKQDLNN